MKTMDLAKRRVRAKRAFRLAAMRNVNLSKWIRVVKNILLLEDGDYAEVKSFLATVALDQGEKQ